MTTVQIEIIKRAVHTYGSKSQIEMVIEECAELIQAIQKVKRYPDNEERIDDMLREVADVEIMIFQLKNMFHAHLKVDAFIDEKVTRLHSRLEASKKAV